MSSRCALVVVSFSVLLLSSVGLTAAAIDYRDALEKSILYYEGQRSGPLPSTQRQTWRGDSALTDGSDVGVDLVGGYYDAGDNVKFGLPLAFTGTLLSWGLIEYGHQIADAGQLDNGLEALKWITDYLLKAVGGPTQLWVQVGNGDLDHACWERPEDMQTSRQSYQVNASYPGTEPAAETAAALAAASIVFKKYLLSNATYGEILIEKAIQVFDFADTYRGSYNDACPYYCSFSGHLDELLWGAAWLYRATGRDKYLTYLTDNAGWSYTMNEFLWDNKMAGLQVLLSKAYFKGVTSLSNYKSQAEEFICENLPASPKKTVTITSGGLLFLQDDNNMQYVATASLLFMLYSDYLANSSQTIDCGGTTFTSADLYRFAKSQVDYALGDNPLGMSFMVGFGENYPTQLHHRAASIPSIHNDTTFYGCSNGYTVWYNSPNANPNTHIGALVGGPNNQDSFQDLRTDWTHTEAMTYINAPMIPVIAKILATKA
ncbi:hypothetical protein R1sor_014206 [Riccia sorocarpa]|uniref:Endoglucanase n=1 Tax=Riccia sorocarpa TaxID=122646 RepID=A0ABD3HBR8_9MARC